MDLDRYWFLTWTIYGTWLPGDPRGNVTSIKDGPGRRHRHNQIGSPYDGDIPGLRASAEKGLKCEPIVIVYRLRSAASCEKHGKHALRS